MGRIEIVLGSADAWEQVADGCVTCSASRTFPAQRSCPSTSMASRARFSTICGDLEVSTFRVSARRADKRFPLTSPQLEREIGGRIKDAKRWTVKLNDPELTIHVEALTGEAFYYFGKEPGPGGMPTGVSGRVVALLSGGIDSPVAAYRLMKRGCRVIPVHFHSYPILSRASQEKVRELDRALDDIPAVHAPVHGRVRRDPAAGHARGATGVAGRRSTAG